MDTTSHRARTRSASDSKKRRLARAVDQLADLLIEVEPLAELLNSTNTPHEYRAMLRELVGARRYFALTNNLDQMCTRAAWEATHKERGVRPGAVAGDDVAPS
ncbi:hypothetical protein L1857_08530 [Amycolatopsis thermalba]|uniref:SIR2-like domain-containing protein n=1 Tax=Amycolatopsis thermalba TaxID=944492 RepID=A0ABY4NS23_9PSEU|nr:MULTISPECIES: hypothetical protein [Amycolatopsis]UQS22859.1 hypothetical protein L1857_08530 [Amycolatopsis thermalba]